MKYVMFFAGLWLACNESLSLDWAVIGLGLTGLSVGLIIDSIGKYMKAR